MLDLTCLGNGRWQAVAQNSKEPYKSQGKEKMSMGDSYNYQADVIEREERLVWPEG
jgi:hypothetical protein